MLDHLHAFGGNGKIDGISLYRKVTENVVPLGIGLTESPAADVQGVSIKTKEKVDKVPENLYDDKKERIFKKIKNNSSQSEETNVKEDKEIRVIMKIDSIRDITDESLNELKATQISDFIAEELRKAAKQYESEKNEVEDALSAAEEKGKELTQQHEDTSKLLSETKEEVEKLKASLETLENEKLERESQEKFNERMTSFDDKYELTDEDREVIAKDIKDLDEEQYEAYSTKMNVLLSGKDKEVLAQKAQEAAKTEEANASEEASEEVTEKVVEDAVDNAEEEKEAIANSTEAGEKSVYDKYKEAFSVENFNIQTKL